MITTSYTTPNNEPLFNQQGGNVTIHLIAAGSQQSTVDPNQPPVLCSRTFLTVSICDARLSPLTSLRGINKRRWNFRKADWPKYTAVTERSIPLIPVNSIPIEESYQRFRGTVMKAAHFSIHRGFRPRYIPCLDEECQVLLA